MLSEMLAGLDEDQRNVVENGWRPGPGAVARALAGAGSGKTHTTVALVGKLDSSGAVDTEDMVITTFTKKAALELTERLRRALPPGRLPSRVGTFHSLAFRALRSISRWDMERCLNLKKRADGVPSYSQSWRLVLERRARGGLVDLIGEPGLGIYKDKTTVAAYESAVEILRSKPVTREELLQAAAEHHLKYLDEALRLHFRLKEQLSAFDMSDLIEAWHAALVSGELGASAQLVAVDEAQDCTAIQLEIARLLAQSGTLLLIGDVRQAIYEWRGASPSILATADIKLGAATLQLRRNYRSGRRIVELGNDICAGESWAVGEPSIPARASDGNIEVLGDNEDARQEAANISADIKAIGQTGGTAVLCRTRAGTGLVEAELMRAAIPCAVAGGSSFFSLRVIQDSLSFYALAQPNGGTADDLNNVLSYPAPRYLGKPTFIEPVRAWMEREKCDVVSAVRGIAKAPNSRLNSSQTRNAHGLADLIQDLRRLTWSQLAMRVASLVGASASEDASEGDGESDVRATAQAMAAIATRFASLGELTRFAERCRGDVKQLDDGENDSGRVVISTIHKAKGLEWDTVYVAGLTAGVFPHAKADTAEREAEERRLFYVAVTRAKNRLVLSWANKDSSGREAGPSEFADLVRFRAENED